MNPAVAGNPARASMEIVSGQASSGRSRPRPWTDLMSSPHVVSRSRMTITANAARFISVYAAR